MSSRNILRCNRWTDQLLFNCLINKTTSTNQGDDKRCHISMNYYMVFICEFCSVGLHHYALSVKLSLDSGFRFNSKMNLYHRHLHTYIIIIKHTQLKLPNNCVTIVNQFLPLPNAMVNIHIIFKLIPFPTKIKLFSFQILFCIMMFGTLTEYEPCNWVRKCCGCFFFILCGNEKNFNVTGKWMCFFPGTFSY